MNNAKRGTNQNTDSTIENKRYQSRDGQQRVKQVKGIRCALLSMNTE